MKIISFAIAASIAYKSSAQKPTPSPVGQNSCCIDTGVCNAAIYSYDIPILDLSDGASDKPNIDGTIDHLGDDIGDSPPIAGWIGNEYSRFLELPMFNGGKNGGGSPRIGTAYLAYDCANKVVCAAAHLDISFLASNPSVQVEQDDDESWIRFGENNGAARLRASNSDAFAYITKPEDDSFIIGYEGCWFVDSIRRLQSVTNNFVEVHFVNNGDTTSTGKPAANGEFVCLKPDCDESTQSPSISPTINIPPISNIVSIPPTGSQAAPSSSPSRIPQRTLSPSVSPTASPSANPSSSPSNSPSLSPIASPTASPSNSPSNSPSLSPSVSPTSSPSADPSSSPSNSPSSSPIASPTASPSANPSNSPSDSPSLSPSVSPTASPSADPSSSPSNSPSLSPIASPTASPSANSPSDSPSLSPSVSPTASPSADPSSSPSNSPSLSPIASPTAYPSANPSNSPSNSPSLSPIASPSASPIVVSERPSASQSANPSMQASSLPSSTPSIQPSPTSSSSPSIAPSESLSGSPSMIPSTTTSAFPSQQPNTQSSSSPSSLTPSLTPSSSHGPTTSLAPSKLGSGLYFPNCFTGEGGPAVCIIDDVGKYELPSATPMYTSLQDCCVGFYAWNFDECMSNGPSNKFFPDWRGEEDSGNACIPDDGTHTVPKGTPKYDTLQECCDTHYTWNSDVCNGVQAMPSNKYYPNWNGADHVCLLDDGTNALPASAPLFDDLASCCDSQYSWNLAQCNGVAGPSNKYFPTWDGVYQTCLLDNGSNTLPFGAPLFDDLLSCCESQYSWKIDECNTLAP